MTDTAKVTVGPDQCPFKVEELPVQQARLDAWSQVRAPGSVYELNGVWYVTSAAGCRTVTRNPQLFSSASHGDTLNAPTPYIPGGIDPPAHLRYRQAIDRKFAPRALASMDERLRVRVNELIDAFIDRGNCDIMPELASIFPAEIFMRIFGLPLADRKLLSGLVHTTLVGAYEGDAAGARAAKDELYRYLEELFVTARAHVADDFVHYLLECGWTGAEVMGTAFNVIQGGLDTMNGAIGLIFYYLATHPELRRQVSEDATSIDTVAEEILRIETPVPFSNRTTTQSVELDGVSIPAGAHVRICYAAANTDPEAFEHPEDVDLQQQKRRDIFTFGGGTHRCLGSHLARKEIRLVVEEFHKRIPDYRLADGAAPAARWPSVVVTLNTVPLVFPPGGRS